MPTNSAIPGNFKPSPYKRNQRSKAILHALTPPVSAFRGLKCCCDQPFGLGPRFALGGFGPPRLIPRRRADLTICAVGASSVRDRYSTLCFPPASLISCRSFFIDQDIIPKAIRLECAAAAVVSILHAVRSHTALQMMPS